MEGSAGSPASKLFLLVGPKGGGKSHIGRILNDAFGVEYVDLEPHWLRILSEQAGPNEGLDIGQGLLRVIPQVERALSSHSVVCVDTTGASDEILHALLSLGRGRQLVIVRVNASLETCLSRIRGRDAWLHIPMDEQGIRQVYERSEMLRLEYHLVLNNEALSAEQLRRAFAPWLI